MARNTPSRDQIAHDVFGRKFSALELDQKQYVTKLLGVLYNASRQGGDPSRLLSTAAMNETAKIVKQLKEIATNPGDVISLPKGVYQDAARVIHYQSQAKGRGRLLDPREMDKIKKEIAKEFGRINPGLVAGITDYLTNATGRFSGVGSKVLRSKLGSFLTKGELESISNAEILAARDIVVSHLFDKWSGGNLSSFIKSRLEDVLEDQRKGLRGLKPAPKDINRAELEDTIRALEIVKHANANLNYANRADFRFACKNLGIDFSKIISPQARGHSANVMHKFAQASHREKFGKAQWDDARNIPRLRMGSGLRFNRRTHRSPVEIKSVYGTGNWATTIRENAARLASDIPSVDMYEYRGTPAEEYWSLDERIDFGALAEDAIESLDKIAEEALEATWNRIEKKGFKESEFVPMGRGAQNIAKMLGYTGGTTSGSGKATFNKVTRRMNGWDLTTTSPSAPVDVHGKIAPAYRDTTLFRSSHIEPRIVSGTDARTLSRLHEAVGIEEENMDIAVLNEIDEYIDRYGKHGKALYEAWVPLHSDDPQYGKLVTWLLTHKGKEAYWAREQLIEKFGSTFPRFEREIKEDTSEKKATGGYRAMEFVDSQFDAVSGLFDTESHQTQKFIGAAEKFREYFNGPSGDIVNLPKHMELYRELAGLGAVKGVTRVGVVGSKSWDNERFMRKFLNANFDKNNIMVAETSVGKGLDESSIGAGYQAANWAYWEDAMLKKIPVRRETITGSHNTYIKDWTMKDVIDSSDEIIAFFDEKTLSTSGDDQFNDLMKYIGKKPCRIIWVPTKLTNMWDEETNQKIKPVSIEDALANRLDIFQRTNTPHNITFEKYTPGTLPHSLTATSLSSEYENGKYSNPIGPLRGFKFLAKGGPLKSNEMAIVGEAGPELLVPSGSGGFNVIPNKALRYLAEGTFTPKKDVGVVTGEQNSAGEHFYRTAAGALFPSVSTIIRYGTKEMQKEMEVFDHIPGWVSDVGTEIHRQVALEMTKRLHGDTSRFETPVDFTKSQGRGRNRTPESLKQMADAAAPNVIKKLDELGFVIGAVEQRFVDFNRGFSGTLDLLGYIDGTPTLIDIKSSSSAPEEKESHRLQLGAYASFFEKDAMPKLMHILPVNRETGEASSPPIIYGEDAIKDAIASFEQQRVNFDYRLHHGDFFNNPNIKDNVEFLRPLIDVHSAIGKLETAIPGLVKAVEENYNVVGEQKYVGEYLNTLANGLKSGDVEMTPQVSSIINLFRKVESAIGDASEFGAGKIRDQISKDNTEYLKKISITPVAQSKTVSSTGKYTADQEDAASARWATWLMSLVPTYDKRSGETYDRPILTSLKDHNAALAKYLPKYGVTGATAEETWDKNPSRLRIYEARLNELLQSRGTVGVHPSIEASLKELETQWDIKDIMQLASHDIGEEDDDPKSIQLFHKVYTDLIKSMGTEKEWNAVLGGTSAMEKMRWEDARTLVNILEEAGKSFKSVPRFSLDNLYTPPTSSSIIPTTVPGPGLPGSPLNPTSASPGTPQPGLPGGIEPPTKTKCKGVDLCQPTLNRFESWFASLRKLGGGTSTGGGTTTSTKGSTTRGSGGSGDIDYEKMFREKFLGEVEHPKGWRKYIERAPITGLPFQMKRKEKEYGRRILEADTDTTDWASLAPKGYWKLLDKETHARNSYFRSLRGATTSWLIAAHVMRIFGQTSQVYNKAHESVMKGFGYIIDMFLMPILPYLAPVVKGLVMIGNVIRQIPAMAIVGGALIGKLIWDTYQWIKAVGGIPKVINAASAAIDKLVTTLERIFPIPDEINNLNLRGPGTDLVSINTPPHRGPAGPNGYLGTGETALTAQREYYTPNWEYSNAPPRPGFDTSNLLGAGKPPRDYNEYESAYKTDEEIFKERQTAQRDAEYKYVFGVVDKVFQEYAASGEVDEDGYPLIWSARQKRTYDRWKKRAGYNQGILKVPGTGNRDTELAMLTPGEMVIPAGTAKKIRGYAEGGVVGGVVGNVLGMYGNIMSTDIAQSIVGGLGVVSKALGAMMAPLAPALAVGAMGGRGFNMVKNAIDRGTSITSRVSEGGFGALRTVASAQLVGLLTGLGPLLPIAAAVIGVYAWLNGYGVAIDGSLRGIRMLTDTVKGILKSFYDVGKKFFDAAKGFFDWLKEKLGLDEKKGVEETKKGGIPDDKWKIIEEERRRRAREKLKGEEVKPEVKPDEKKSIWERITDKFPWLRGVPGMTLLGGVIGAAESKEPTDWAKSGLMGGAAQIAFNVGEKVLTKLGLPGGKIMGGLGGFLAPDFGEHIGKAFVSGEGPLGIGKYLGLQGNRTAERAVSMIATQLMTGTSIVGNIGAGISDAIGGTDLKGGILQQILGGNSKISGDYSAMGELYEFGYNNPKVAPMASMLPGGTIMLGGSQMAALVQIANDISKLVDNTKQPIINNNHIEMSNSDPFALFQQFVQWLGTAGNTQGLQRTI